MNIGESIREARIKAGMSQKELAEKTGLAAVTIQQYERGVRQPRFENVKKISDVLNIPGVNIVGDLALSQIEKMISEMEKQDLYSPPENEPEREIYCLDRDYAISLIDQLNYSGLGRASYYLEDLAKIPEYRKDTTTDESSN